MFLSSCNDDELQRGLQSIVKEKIEVKDGVLSFSSSELLEKKVKELKSLDDTKLKNKSLNSYYEQGFKPLFPNYVEGDERIKEFIERKKARFDKIRAYNQQILQRSEGDIDEDGELVEEYDDDLISDDEFASLLNEEREIIVDNILYKYTYSGMFSVASEKKPELDNYIAENNIEYLIPEPSTLERGSVAVTENINRRTPTISEMNHIETCEGDVYTDPNAFQTVFQEQCAYAGGSGGNYSGYNNVDHNQNLINYMKSLTPCKTYTGALHFWGAFGTTQKCYENFSDKYRTKTKFWKENYFVYKSIGVKVKHQKKGWIGFWRTKKTDEVILSISQATFEFSMPITLPATYFQPKFYFFEDKVFNSQSQILTYFDNTVKPPKPELPWNAEVVLVEWIPYDLTTTQVRELFYQGAWSGAKLIVNDLKNRDPSSFTHLLYNNGKVFVNHVDLTKRKLDSKKIVNVFDFNFNLGVKFNVDIGSNGELTTSYDSFGSIISSVQIPRVYDYSNIEIDFAGITRKGSEWKGSRIVYKD